MNQNNITWAWLSSYGQEHYAGKRKIRDFSNTKPILVRVSYRFTILSWAKLKT